MKKIIKDKMYRFNYLASEIETLFHEASFKLGLSDSAMKVLYTVCINGNSCMLSHIYKMSGISKQTVNSAVRKLEKENVIYLEKLDGRAKEVCLTDEGVKKVESTVLPLMEMESESFCSWSKEELDLYLELTQKYVDTFKEQLKKL